MGYYIYCIIYCCTLHVWNILYELASLLKLYKKKKEEKTPYKTKAYKIFWNKELYKEQFEIEILIMCVKYHFVYNMFKLIIECLRDKKYRNYQPTVLQCIGI